ncbi:MAG: hypothetical protein HDT40_10740 [Lachnospiraceae bacterium]|nr:hypothetical protein [Lachnospiraceae bacterium]
MSKKCCGIIYSDDEQVCKICGKPLNEEIAHENNEEFNIDDITAMLDKISKDIGGDDEAVETDTGETGMENADIPDKGEDITDETSENDGWVTVEAPKSEKKADKPKKNENEKASKGLKTAGILFLTLAVLGFVLVGLCVYFMVFNPYYDKNGEHYPLNYPQISSASDAYEMSDMLELMTDTDASPSDAEAKEGE